MNIQTNSLDIAVDPTNPGQFFACCGVFEIAQYLFDDCNACFSIEQDSFAVYSKHEQLSVEAILQCVKHIHIGNTMSSEQKERLQHLRSMTTSQTNAAEKIERKELESINRKAEIVLGTPANLEVDWFADTRSGGSRLKTWAGQQGVLEIATEMQRLLNDDAYDEVGGQDVFSVSIGDSIGFNFDSALGSHSSAIDVGFVLDPLGMNLQLRPAIELLAFIGLQRFRPSPVTDKRNSYAYATWSRPDNIWTAAVKATALVPTSDVSPYKFSLLYRTKYLKSFLPAEPLE